LFAWSLLFFSWDLPTRLNHSLSFHSDFQPVELRLLSGTPCMKEFFLLNAGPSVTCLSPFHHGIPLLARGPRDLFHPSASGPTNVTPPSPHSEICPSSLQSTLSIFYNSFTCRRHAPDVAVLSSPPMASVSLPSVQEMDLFFLSLFFLNPKPPTGVLIWSTVFPFPFDL